MVHRARALLLGSLAIGASALGFFWMQRGIEPAKAAPGARPRQARAAAFDLDLRAASAGAQPRSIATVRGEVQVADSAAAGVQICAMAVAPLVDDDGREPGRGELATLIAFRELGSLGGSEALWRAACAEAELFTDEAGQFELPVGDALPQLLLARSANHPGGLAVATTADGPPVEIYLHPGRALRGSVVDETGGAIAGARVSLVSMVGLGSAVTDVAGRYQMLVGTERRDRFLVGVAHPAFDETVAERNPRASNELDPVILGHAIALRGQVVHHGKPFAGAEVVLSLDNSLQAMLRSHALPRSVRSDAAGRFEIAGIPLDTALWLRAQHGDLRSELFEARAGEDAVDAIELELADPGAVEVRAVDEEQRPIAGATVRVLTREVHDWQPVAELTTDAAGRARTARLPLQPYKVEVSAPGRISADGWIDAGTDEPTEIEVRLNLGHRLLFHVVDDAGKPLADPDFEVEVMIESADDMAHREAPVNAGTAEIVDALAGEATARLVGPRSSGRHTAVHFQVPGEVPTLVWPRPKTISGTVRDDRGAPARGFVVTASCATGDGEDWRTSDSTNRQGAFELDVIGASRCDLTLEGAHDLEVCTRLQDVAADQAGVEFTVPSPLAIEVVDSSGLPVAETALELLADGAYLWGVRFTDRDGRMEVARCLTGTVMLSARDVRTMLSTDAARVEPGTSSARLQLAAHASVRGQVVTPDGRLARRFTVRLRGVDRHSQMGGFWGGGRFFLTRVPLGRFTMEIESPATGASTIVAFAIDRSEELDLGTIELQPPAPEADTDER